jgi:hypothetical protein
LSRGKKSQREGTVPRLRNSVGGEAISKADVDLYKSTFDEAIFVIDSVSVRLKPLLITYQQTDEIKVRSAGWLSVESSLLPMMEEMAHQSK